MFISLLFIIFYIIFLLFLCFLYCLIFQKFYFQMLIYWLKIYNFIEKTQFFCYLNYLFLMVLEVRNFVLKIRS